MFRKSVQRINDQHEYLKFDKKSRQYIFFIIIKYLQQIKIYSIKILKKIFNINSIVFITNNIAAKEIY